MSRRALSVVFGLALAAPTVAPSSGSGQEKGGEVAPPPMGPPAEMKELAGMNGSWNVEFQYQSEPGQPWVTSKAVATIQMVLGGAAQQMDYTGEMMGMTFQGTGLTCYDRETHKWQSTWIDNLAARISSYEGDLEDGKLVQEGIDWAQGEKIHSRSTTFNITDKRFEWSMEISLDGEHYMTSARAVYTRR